MPNTIVSDISIHVRDKSTSHTVYFYRWDPAITDSDTPNFPGREYNRISDASLGRLFQAMGRLISLGNRVQVEEFGLFFPLPIP